MSSATIVSEAYGEGACLYETVLGVSKDATASQLRKAYYKKCLSYHPDKLSAELSNDERELSKKKFQAISFAYAILSDEEKRKEYDDSGEFYDDDDFATSKEGVNQWTEYFNNIFPKVTTADIEAFEVKYKCSDEEEADVLKYYSQFKGDLNKMLECVMLSSDVDKERWVKDYIGPAMKRGDVADYMMKIQNTLGHAPAKKTKRKKSSGKSGKKKAENIMEEDVASDDESDTPVAQVVDEMDDDEAGVRTNENKKAPTKKSSKNVSDSCTRSSTSAAKKESLSKNAKSSKKSANPDDNLIAQIRGNAVGRRQAGFESLMAGLEERYGGDKKKSGKKRQQQQNQRKDDGDIDDDEFARIQAKMMKNKESKQRSK